MIALLENIVFWHWWVLAALLVASEMIAPSTVLLWPGISAAFVGVVVFAFREIGWELQVLLFALLSVVTLIAWRGFARGRPQEGGDPALNRRGQQYVGRSFVLNDPIVNGEGRLKVDDTIWKIAGEDAAAGARVSVVAVDGAVLRVERGRENGPAP